MTQPKLIQDNFQYGRGDDGVTTAKVGERLYKNSPEVQAYNKLEKWVFALSDAYLELDAYTDIRIRMGDSILSYLRDKAYVIGAMFYTQDYSWELDEELLRWMRLEIQTLEGHSHNFVTPNLTVESVRALEWLRIETRELEGCMWDAFADQTVNHAVVNRLSSYVYHLSNYIRTKYGKEKLNDVEWDVEKNPKFEEYRP